METFNDIMITALLIISAPVMVFFIKEITIDELQRRKYLKH